MTIGYKSGDIVLSKFYFSDGRGSKVRPVLILHKTRDEYLVAAISSQTHQKQTHDIILDPDGNNGLRAVSIVRLSKIGNFSGETFHKKLGNIDTKKQNNLKMNMIDFVKSR